MTNSEHILASIRCHEECVRKLMEELKHVDPKEPMWRKK